MSRFSVKSFVKCLVPLGFALYYAADGLPAAQAGCGDYVHLRGPGSHDLIAVGTVLTSTHSMPRGRHRDNNAPCDGPHCRQQPASPGMPVPAPGPVPPQQAACLIQIAAQAAYSSTGAVSDGDRVPRERTATRIERPPRDDS
ncbi:MAG: hypothetical protein HY290_14840 [Planctomycetia bacterium]|nr:hypothetical protein [Planctomycetia bacterium]